MAMVDFQPAGVFPFSRLAKELRDEVYEEVFNMEQEVLLFTMSWSELKDALQAATPLLYMDDHGFYHREALIYWLQTRKYIIEGVAHQAFADADALLTPYNIDVYAEVRRVEIWAWDVRDLDVAASELAPCAGLKQVKVLLGDNVHISIARAAKIFKGLRGPLQVFVYREDEHIENEAPACKRIVDIPARVDGAYKIRE